MRERGISQEMPDEEEREGRTLGETKLAKKRLDHLIVTLLFIPLLVIAVFFIFSKPPEKVQDNREGRSMESVSPEPGGENMPLENNAPEDAASPEESPASPAERTTEDPLGLVYKPGYESPSPDAAPTQVEPSPEIEKTPEEIKETQGDSPGKNILQFDDPPEEKVVKKNLDFSYTATPDGEPGETESPEASPQPKGKGNSEPAEDVKSLVIIRSNLPSNAEVFLQNLNEKTFIKASFAKRANGYYEYSARPGGYLMKVTGEGYYTIQKRFKLAGGKVFELRGEMERKSILNVTSKPTGATVFLNGKKKGKTPITLRWLVEGEYSLKILKDDYNGYVERIRVKKGKDVERKIELTRYVAPEPTYYPPPRWYPPVRPVKPDKTY